MDELIVLPILYRNLRMINNRNIKARDFYYRKPTRLSCFHCDSIANLYELDDGFDSYICFDCLDKTLEELNCKDDFESNDFNKKEVSCKRFPRKEWE